MSALQDHVAGSYLRAYLSHLDEWLDAPDVTDIFVNAPGVAWIETTGAPPRRVEVPALDAATLERLARQIAGRSQQAVSRRAPLLAATLPDGARVQVVVPPATRGDVALAIRKQAIRAMTLDTFEAAGFFDGVRLDGRDDRAEDDERLHALLAAGDAKGFLRTAVRQRRNIVLCGGTSTGKTTFLNALVREIPDDERLIAIEDTPEVRLDHSNSVGLVAHSGGDHDVTVDQLLRASLRMRPSRLILGELRGAEAYSFLRAINTGHPGSITTIHADSPTAAVEQLALMVLQSGTTLSRADVLAYIGVTVDVFVQLSRRDGRRAVSSIRFRPKGS